jgi:hypothetical protein
MPPTASVRVTPTGIKLKNGYQTFMFPSTNPGIHFYEMRVKPSGEDGGPKINTTTMHNSSRRTYAPQALTESTDMTVTAAYDPLLKTDIAALVNVEDTYTTKFPDGTTEAIYAFLQKAEFSDLQNGEMPTVTLTFCPTNTVPTTGAESAPVLTNVAGT